MQSPVTKVFNYHPELDCFTINPNFAYLCEQYKLNEWKPIVWMGRLFALNQDLGEHAFDNWEEQESLGEKSRALGIEAEDLIVIVPMRFTAHDPYCLHCCPTKPTPVRMAICPDCDRGVMVGVDGPCYSPAAVKSFWTDVLKSIKISEETLALISKEQNDDVGIV